MLLLLLVAFTTVSFPCIASENQSLIIEVGACCKGIFKHKHLIISDDKKSHKKYVKVRELYEIMKKAYGTGTLLATCNSFQATCDAPSGVVEQPKTYMALDINALGGQTLGWLLKHNHLSDIEQLQFQFVPKKYCNTNV